MGLVGDVREVKELWARVSLPGKFALALSVFLASASLASLADTVYAWKGFVFDGVDFYRDWISEPIAYLLTNIGIRIDPKGVDVLFLIELSVLSYSVAENSRPGQLLITFMLVLAPWLWLGHLLTEIANEVLWISMYLYPSLLLIGNGAILHGGKRIFYFTVIGVAVGIVLILGAIGEGLSRPMA